MFEKAVRMKLRFESIKGQLSVEQLWELPLTSQRGDSLDSLAMKYNKLVKESEETSFVEEVKKDSLCSLRLDILKYIISVRLKEKDEAKVAVVNKSEIERLLAIKARKLNLADEELSPEDLDKKIAELKK